MTGIPSMDKNTTIHDHVDRHVVFYPFILPTKLNVLAYLKLGFLKIFTTLFFLVFENGILLALRVHLIFIL